MFPLALLLLPGLLAPMQGTAAVVEIHGGIGEAVDAQDTVELLQAADAEYDAVIIDIDSPGGTTVDSHELVRTISGMKSPAVALIRNSGTSGAYWVAAACDRIVADELSFVGSIGAFMTFVSVEELTERYGVRVVTTAHPGNKSFGSPFRDLSPAEQRHAQALTESAAGYFNESMTGLRPGAAAYFDGLPYLARDAPELVDTYGGFQLAKEEAEELAGRKLKIERIRQPQSFRGLLRDAIGLRADAPFNLFELLFQVPYDV